MSECVSFSTRIWLVEETGEIHSVSAVSTTVEWLVEETADTLFAVSSTSHMQVVEKTAETISVSAVSSTNHMQVVDETPETQLTQPTICKWLRKVRKPIQFPQLHIPSPPWWGWDRRGKWLRPTEAGIAFIDYKMTMNVWASE
jgi:hypothetical protein